MVATSRRFAVSEELLILARLAQQWHCRPSELIKSDIVDFQIDVAAAIALWKSRKELEADDVVE